MAASPAQTEPTEPASAGIDLGAFLAGSGGVGLLLIVSVAARLMTYDVVADGSYEAYVRSVVIAAVSAIIVAVLLAWQFTPAYIWAAAGLILTLLPGDAWHYARLWSAEQFAQEEVVFEETFRGHDARPGALGERARLRRYPRGCRWDCPGGDTGRLHRLAGAAVRTGTAATASLASGRIAGAAARLHDCLGDALSACRPVLHPCRSSQPRWPPVAAASSSRGLAPHAPNGRWADRRH